MARCGEVRYGHTWELSSDIKVEFGWIGLGWIELPKARSNSQPTATKCASVDDAGFGFYWGDIELKPTGVVGFDQLRRLGGFEGAGIGTLLRLRTVLS